MIVSSERSIERYEGYSRTDIRVIIQSTSFRSGFVIGICSCALVNSLTYQADWGFRIFDYFHPHGLFDLDALGVPFTYYYWSSSGSIGIPSDSHFAWIEAISDILIAVAFSSLAGLVFKIAASKMRRP